MQCQAVSEGLPGLCSQTFSFRGRGVPARATCWGRTHSVLVPGNKQGTVVTPKWALSALECVDEVPAA